MSAEIPFHYQAEDDRYSIDVIRDNRDPDVSHFDVDLVRSRAGQFGEPLEQCLTLAEYDDRNKAEGLGNITMHYPTLEHLEDPDFNL